MLPKVILKVAANDSDKGANSELEYSISYHNDSKLETVVTSKVGITNKSIKKLNPIVQRDPELPLFDIEPRSGEISLVDTSALSSRCQSALQTAEHRGIPPLANRELGKYNIVVTATDKGSIQLSATAQIFIRVITTDVDMLDKVSIYPAIIKNVKSSNLTYSESWI